MSERSARVAVAPSVSAVPHAAGSAAAAAASTHVAPVEATGAKLGAAPSSANAAADDAASSSPPSSSWSYTARTLLAGGLAGCVAKTAVAPLDRVKILFQGANPTVKHFSGSIWGGFRAIWWIGREQGIRGVYKGHQATLLRIFPYAALNYACFEQYKRLLIRQQLLPLDCTSSADLPPVARLLAGSAAGLTSVLFTYPLDYVHSRITYQVKLTRYKGIGDTITQTMAEGGIRGLYRGFGATALGIIPYAGMSFLTYDTLKHSAGVFYAQQQFHEQVAAAHAAGLPPPTEAAATAHVPVAVRLVSGALAGAAAQTASYPLDVVRRRMQLYGLSSQLPLYRNTAHALWSIIQTEGVRKLYIGLSINYIKVAPAHALSFVTYEWAKTKLNIK